MNICQMRPYVLGAIPCICIALFVPEAKQKSIGPSRSLVRHASLSQGAAKGGSVTEVITNVAGPVTNESQRLEDDSHDAGHWQDDSYYMFKSTDSVKTGSGTGEQHMFRAWILKDLADEGGGTEWSSAVGLSLAALLFGGSRLVEMSGRRANPSWFASLQGFSLVSDIAVWYGATSFQLAACSRLVENSSATMQAIIAWLQVTSGGLLLVPAVLLAGRKLLEDVPRDLLLCLAISGMCFMIGAFCVMQGLAATSTAFVGGIRCLEPFTTVLLGGFFGLAADFARLQVFGIMSAVVGVLFSNFGLVRHSTSVTSLLSTIITIIFANIMFSSRNLLISFCNQQARLSKSALLGLMCMSGSVAGLFVVSVAAFAADNHIFDMHSIMTIDMATSVFGFVLYNAASIYVLCRVQVLMHAMLMSGKGFASVLVAYFLAQDYLDAYAIFGIFCLVAGAGMFELSKSSGAERGMQQAKEKRTALRVKRVGDLSPQIIMFMSLSMLAVPVCLFANQNKHTTVGAMLQSSHEYSGQVYSMSWYIDIDTGDANSSPGRWWPEIIKAAGITNNKVTVRNLQPPDDWLVVPDGSLLVVGGGGMFGIHFEPDILESLDHSGPVAFWGMGLNHESTIAPDVSILPDSVDKIQQKAKLHTGKFFFSLRDYDSQNRWRWVPCASSMNPFFTSASLLGKHIRTASEQLAARLGVKERVGVIKHVVAEGEYCGQHLSQWVKEGLTTEQDVTENTGPDMNRILRFIQKYDVIVTTSYHSAFWATLLNKKVVICKGWSSKLYYFKHPPVFYSGDLSADIQKAKRYPEALKEARDANIQFAQEVMSQS